ncbi:MAG: hypothetical protein JSR48_01055 [Verrucomicrobia bacterium]|nr:hypothetical protein [Verrucomicrobiota bacterium]
MSPALRHARLLLAVLGAVALLAAAEPPAPLIREAAGRSRAGEEAYLSGRAGEAVSALAEAERLYRAAGDLPGAIRADVNLALAQRGAADAAAAQATAQRARELLPAAVQQARERPDGTGEVAELAVMTAWLEALLALDRGEGAPAAGLLEKLPGALPSGSPWPGRVETLRAELDLNRRQWAAAVAHARAGQAASAAARDRAEEARALRLAGAAEMGLGKWGAARADLLAAVRLEESLGGGARMAGDLAQLATIAGQLGDPAGARLYAARAQAITAARAR